MARPRILDPESRTVNVTLEPSQLAILDKLAAALSAGRPKACKRSEAMRWALDALERRAWRTERERR